MDLGQKLRMIGALALIAIAAIIGAAGLALCVAARAKP